MDDDASQEHLQWSVGEITLGKENAEKKLCQTMEVGCANGGREGGREREREILSMVPCMIHVIIHLHDTHDTKFNP